MQPHIRTQQACLLAVPDRVRPPQDAALRTRVRIALRRHVHGRPVVVNASGLHVLAVLQCHVVLVAGPSRGVGGGGVFAQIVIAGAGVLEQQVIHGPRVRNHRRHHRCKTLQWQLPQRIRTTDIRAPRIHRVVGEALHGRAGDIHRAGALDGVHAFVQHGSIA